MPVSLVSCSLMTDKKCGTWKVIWLYIHTDKHAIVSTAGLRGKFDRQPPVTGDLTPPEIWHPHAKFPRECGTPMQNLLGNLAPPMPKFLGNLEPH